MVELAERRGVTSMSEGKFWFCLKHHAVEGDEGCPHRDRLGPYDTAEGASRALEKVKERNEQWDNDPDWNDSDLED
jgi:hypothetical protein